MRSLCLLLRWFSALPASRNDFLSPFWSQRLRTNAHCYLKRKSQSSSALKKLQVWDISIIPSWRQAWKHQTWATLSLRLGTPRTTKAHLPSVVPAPPQLLGSPWADESQPCTLQQGRGCGQILPERPPPPLSAPETLNGGEDPAGLNCWATMWSRPGPASAGGPCCLHSRPLRLGWMQAAGFTVKMQWELYYWKQNRKCCISAKAKANQVGHSDNKNTGTKKDFKILKYQ